jgi:hypothetical protein
MNSKWNQSDYISENGRLWQEVVTLETELQLRGKQAPSRPDKKSSVDGSNVLAEYDALSAHTAKLKALVNSSEKNVRAGNDNNDKPTQTSDAGCEACKTTGRCARCNGTGVEPGSTASNSCKGGCAGSGKCDKCGGTGKKDGKAAASTAWNPDAEILKANGVGTIAELNTKLAEQRGVRPLPSDD